MSQDLDRRGFLQELLATVGSAVLVGKVRPPEAPALAGLEAPEALEYDPGNSEQSATFVASVKRSPLSFEKNFGFRYLASSGSGVRLYYDRSPHDEIFVQSPLGEAQAMFAIADVGPKWVEVRAHDIRSGDLTKADFYILVMRMRLMYRVA